MSAITPFSLVATFRTCVFLFKVSCWNPTEMCNMTVRSGTCYCCDLYDCAKWDKASLWLVIYLSVLLCHHILNRRTQSSVINTTVVLLCSGGYLSNYYEFVGVQSCEEVFTLYILIWMLTGLNLVAFFTGILNTAVLGSIKDLVRHTHTHTSTNSDLYL